jgi:tetratricopeptide (TPR) repeat protein
MIRSFRIAAAALATLGVLGLAACRPAAKLGDCSNAQTDANTLVAACTVAIQAGGLDPADFSSAYLGRARGYMLQQKFDPAIEDLSTLIAKQPNNPIPYGDRAAAYASRGDLDLAFGDYQYGVHLAPDWEWGYVGMGHVYEEKHDYAHAIDSFSHAIAIHPGNAIALNGRCWTRAIVGKELDEAASDCERSLRYASGDANTINSLAFVRFRKNQYADAIRGYDDAIARDPKVASSWYFRGLAKLALGDATGADDVAKGKSLEPGVADRYQAYGIPAVR